MRFGLSAASSAALLCAPRTARRAPAAAAASSCGRLGCVWRRAVCERRTARSALSRGSGCGGPGPLRVTRLCHERNVVRNTLADTPSGYIQDPRVYPRTMPRYDSVSRVGAAALEAMERERELLEREELAYPGYTTLRIQALKEVVMTRSTGDAELRSTAEGLQEELCTLQGLLGREVDKPMSAQRLLLLKWQQRQRRLQDRERPFQLDPPRTPTFRVVVRADGTEEIERPGRDTTRGPVHETDDAYLSQPVEAEVLPPEMLVAERTVITAADVNHVRYLLGLTLRRLGRFDEAERIFYAILADDVTNVDAVESLLELDTGIEGWTPRIRDLLDYLHTEYTRAVAEGRLQSTASNSGATSAAAAAAPSSNSCGASTPSPPPPPRSASLPADAVEAVELSKGGVVRSSAQPGYDTLPQVAPTEVALSLLSDMIVEAAAKKCAADGEGAASRFFIEALGPIVRALGRDYAPRLLEALFHAVDEQHFSVRFDSADVSAAARTLALSVVIAFLKALLARRIHEMLPESTRFHFFALVKLHTALRGAGRAHESYKICEQLIELYRAHSSVYRARARAASHGSASSLPWSAVSSALLARPGSGGSSGSSGGSSGGGAGDDATSPAPLSSAAGEEEEEEAPDVLDDQDKNYREAMFRYVNDRARDSTALGRRLCVEAMAEFPRCAAPWETLALLLHKEDPKHCLGDAIIAARRAMELEPFNISVIATLANFYKAAGRYELFDRMMDRYRLLSYMVEEGASEADMIATAEEIAALDAQTPAAQDIVEETGREMKEFMERLEQATTYSMPIDKEVRPFSNGPVRLISQQPEMRPVELAEVRDTPAPRPLQVASPRRQQR
ncbi:hypothetical protein NESM_000345800 [Novymonas esmeraldas]|uniref:Uncharacterized protein n=1 Tax=Novymonas esmeraldas TaxID=1808958 RepID=A0AAW0EJH8_9TRYP